MDIHTPLTLPDTWWDRLADAYWSNRGTLRIVVSAFVFGAVMAAAALVNL